MTNITRTAVEMAAYWVIRFSQDDPVSSCEAWSFVEWLCRSPENVIAFRRMCWLDMRLKLTRRSDFAAKRPESNVVELRPNRHRSIEVVEAPRADPLPGRKRVATGWSMAAIAATLLIALPVTLTMIEGHAPISTSLLDQKVVKLDDGAVVHLGHRSGLQSEFQGDRQVVYLRSGQAMFEVPNDLRTPFIVRTDLVEVAAEPGSHFTVKVDDSSLVAMGEGHATVAPRGQPNSAEAVKLRPGMVARAFLRDGQVVITSMESKQR